MDPGAAGESVGHRRGAQEAGVIVESPARGAHQDQRLTEGGATLGSAAYRYATQT